MLKVEEARKQSSRGHSALERGPGSPLEGGRPWAGLQDTTRKLGLGKITGSGRQVGFRVGGGQAGALPRDAWKEAWRRAGTEAGRRRRGGVKGEKRRHGEPCPRGSVVGCLRKTAGLREGPCLHYWASDEEEGAG